MGIIIQLSRTRGVPRSIGLLFKQTDFWSIESTDNFVQPYHSSLIYQIPYCGEKPAYEMLKLIWTYRSHDHSRCRAPSDVLLYCSFEVLSLHDKKYLGMISQSGWMFHTVLRSLHIVIIIIYASFNSIMDTLVTDAIGSGILFQKTSSPTCFQINKILETKR